MEVRDHEVRVGKRNVDADVAEEQPRQPADHERADEADGKQHRYGQVDVAPPQRQHPVVDLERGRDGDDERGGGKEEPEVRVHARHEHVVRPDDERQHTDDEDGPHHHPVAEDILARVRADEVRHDAEGGQRDDVHLGVSEEPEQVLEQQRAAAAVLELLPH
ncbi:hypothetical protein DL770_011445 [Monosporascus sp. CRB-9-2]|nr:hypothetical protein DL770_011445 [Monosporascus sp. CRB-9-2]